MEHKYYSIGTYEWAIQLCIVCFFFVGLLVLPLCISSRKRQVLAKVLAVSLFLVMVFGQLYYVWIGEWNLRLLPFEFCNLMAMASVIALLSQHQWFYELCLFLGVVAPFQAFISPAIYCGEDAILYDLFYAEHILLIYSPLYMTFFLHMRPRKWSWFTTPLSFVPVIVPIMLINEFAGTNYMFLAERPEVLHPFNFGLWPFYILLWIVALFLISFVISRMIVPKNGDRE